MSISQFYTILYHKFHTLQGEQCKMYPLQAAELQENFFFVFKLAENSNSEFNTSSDSYSK